MRIMDKQIQLLIHLVTWISMSAERFKWTTLLNFLVTNRYRRNNKLWIKEISGKTHIRLYSMAKIIKVSIIYLIYPILSMFFKILVYL